MRILQQAMLRYTLGLAACAAAVACGSEGITGSESRFVPPPLSVQPSVVTLTIGGSTKLLANLPAGSGSRTTEVVWRSGSDSIASVTATGLVHGLKRGRTRITATWRGQHGSALITVVSAGGVNKHPLCASGTPPGTTAIVPKDAPQGPCR
jgi:hypothetical protein